MTQKTRNARLRALGGLTGTVALLGTLAVVAAPAAVADDRVADSGLTEFHEQEINWSPCAEEELAGLECARVVVPLDYTDPEGDRIQVAVSRRAADESGARRGVLLLNPGGPGGPGRGMENIYEGQAVTGSYDLIGFDPRGVGASTQLNCSVPDDYGLNLPSRPTDAELRLFTQSARELEEGCDRTAGGIRPHISTANTARDMDVIRAVLGEDEINYVGYSYGTYLGAVYGSLFPERLDRSVLDSSVHPDRIWNETWLAMSPAHTENVERFADWAATEEVGLGASAEEARATIEQIAQQLHEEPVDGLNRTAFDQFMGLQGRYQGEWDLFAEILLALRAGESPAASDAAEAVTLSVEASRDVLVPGAFDTVRCEAPWPSGVGSYYRDMREYRTEHPYGTGVYTAAPSTCTFLSFTPPEPPVELERDGYPAGIVVQAEYDPQTAYEGGPAMANRLRNNLIIVEDDGGHGFYGMPDHDCVTERVNDYLVNGVLPASASTCPGLPRPETDGVETFDTGNLAERMRDNLDERPESPANS